MTATKTVTFDTLASVYESMRERAEGVCGTAEMRDTLNAWADALEELEDGLEDQLEQSFENGFDEGALGERTKKVTPWGVEDVRNHDGGYDVFVATKWGPDVQVGSYGTRYEALLRVDEIKKVMGL